MFTPDLLDGDCILGTTFAAWPVAGELGEICHCPGGGGVPQLELEEVLRLWPKVACVAGGVPSVNCTLGGDNWQISGIAGGAETFRIVGLSGMTRACFRTPAGLCSIRRSSGNGPKVDPPEAELMPDMAETESPERDLDLTKEACICW